MLSFLMFLFMACYQHKNYNEDQFNLELKVYIPDY